MMHAALTSSPSYPVPSWYILHHFCFLTIQTGARIKATPPPTLTSASFHLSYLLPCPLMIMSMQLNLHVCMLMNKRRLGQQTATFLHKQTIREWKDLDQIHPHDAHASRRVTRTYHNHFGVPMGCQIGFWDHHDDQKRKTKPTLPSYLLYNIPNHLSCALSRLRLSGHNLNIKQR